MEKNIREKMFWLSENASGTKKLSFVYLKHGHFHGEKGQLFSTIGEAK